MLRHVLSALCLPVLPSLAAAGRKGVSSSRWGGVP